MSIKTGRALKRSESLFRLVNLEITQSKLPSKRDLKYNDVSKISNY